MVSVAIGVDGKKIEVPAHHRRRNISEFVNIVQGPLLGQSESQSLQDIIHSEICQCFRIADKQFQQIDLFDSAIVIIDCLVGVRDVGMADPVGSG